MTDLERFNAGLEAALTAAEYYSGEEEFQPVEDFLGEVRILMAEAVARQVSDAVLEPDSG